MDKKVIAYIRVSTVQQDTDVQRSTIRSYAKKNKLKIKRFVELEMSSRKSLKERKIDELLTQLNPGDTLIVSELSRLARSVGQISILVSELVQNKVKLICIKEDIRLSSRPSIATKVQITMFSLFAEIERDLISLRTKEGLQAARAKGIRLGRRRGSMSNSRFDEHREHIQKSIKIGVPLSRIMQDIGGSRTALEHYIRTRNLR